MAKFDPIRTPLKAGWVFVSLYVGLVALLGIAACLRGCFARAGY